MKSAPRTLSALVLILCCALLLAQPSPRVLRVGVVASAQQNTAAPAAPRPEVEDVQASSAKFAAAVRQGPTVRGGWARLPGGVPAALADSHRLPGRAGRADEPLSVTVVLRRTDEAGFARYLRDVYDPASPRFRRFLTQRELTARFGPSRKAYESLLAHLRRGGLTLIEGSENRLTLTLRGTRAQAERAFDVEIKDYERGGRRFYSNDADPALPRPLARNVLAVTGLSDLAVPRPATEGLGILAYLYNGVVVELAGANQLLATATAGEVANAAEMAVAINRIQVILDAEAAAAAASAAFRAGLLGRLRAGDVPPAEVRAGRPPSAQAAAQKVGIPSFTRYRASDLADNLALFRKPASLANQVSRVPVDGGGRLTPDQVDVLLSANMILTLAPTSQVVVYDAPLMVPGTSFQALFNAMLNDGVNVVSNSFGYCEDQTTAADVASIDAILQTAAASGVSVFNATGDFGGQCIDGSPNTISVPADSPNATAVGGSSLTFGPGFTYAGEKWWNGAADLPPSGQGGFGVSRFFARPAYQNGLVSGTARSVPDVVATAWPGVPVCTADLGGCGTARVYGGTSLATPIWAGLAAIINNNAGSPVGFLNPKLYPLAGTNVFHTAASMGSDAAHVGLGSPNGNLLDLALRGKAPGAVSPSVSTVSASFSDPLVPFMGYVLADDSRAVNVVVNLYDADGNMVPGKTVTLSASAGSHAVVTPASAVSSAADGSAVFTVKDATAESVTFTAKVDGVTLNQTRTVRFIAPPPAAAGIAASPTTVTANGADAATITVTLLDSKGNGVPGKQVNLSQGNGSSSVSATTATTDASGKVQFTATSFTAGTVTYTAFDVTDNLPLPGSASVNFVNPAGNCERPFNGTAAAGYAASTFASSFPVGCFDSVGPIGLAFDRAGTLFVASLNDNGIYKFGPQGGIAGPATLVGKIPQSFGLLISGITFTKDGRLYANLENGAKVLEVNPTTGAVVRVVAQTADAPLDIHQDPLSGDLFVSAFSAIYRISNYENGPGTVTTYISGGFFDGFVFAEDGTIYTKAAAEGRIYRITGTNTPNPGTATLLVTVGGGVDGVALEPNPANPSKPFVYANRNDGRITRIDTTSLPPASGDPPTCGQPGAPCTDIYTNGSRGDFVAVGPSGCLYATQTDRVVKVTNADGTCGLAPTDAAPRITLTPELLLPQPAQGTNVTFTATLHNVSSPEGTPIQLLVLGPNFQTILARADANGQAKFTYAGNFTGEDVLVATAPAGAQGAVSNRARVTWTSGAHTTFLSLNQSPGAGSTNRPLALAGTLVDASASPSPSPVAGASVSFALAGQNCTATTDAAGRAACTVTPTAAPDTYQLTANFAGGAQLLPSAATKAVDLLSAPAAGVTSVQFSASSYDVSEGCAALVATVTRTGDTSGSTTVDYASSDATAKARTDYTTALGTLRFAPGETAKTFGVLVTRDFYDEGEETFNLSLSNAVGAALGSTSTAAVRIIDAGAQPGNPIDSSRPFVCQHYHDFLNRQSDQSGEDFWTQNIEQCGTNTQCRQVFRVETSAAFFLSIEFRETGYVVIRANKAAFGNQKGVPRYLDFIRDQRVINDGVVVGAQGWEAKLAANKQAYLAGLVTRTNFVAQFPEGMAAAGFVDKLFANAGVTPTSAERAAALAAYGAGDVGGRTAALLSVIESGSVFNAHYNPAFVLMQYFGYLRRDPDAAPDADFTGYDFWLGKMNSFSLPGEDMRDDAQAMRRAQRAEMVRAFVESIEYRQRFGPP